LLYIPLYIYIYIYIYISMCVSSYTYSNLYLMDSDIISKFEILIDNKSKMTSR